MCISSYIFIMELEGTWQRLAPLQLKCLYVQPNPCFYYVPMVHAQLCSEWHWLPYWSPVQIFCYHRINSLRQNLYRKTSLVKTSCLVVLEALDLCHFICIQMSSLGGGQWPKWPTQPSHTIAHCTLTNWSMRPHAQSMIGLPLAPWGYSNIKMRYMCLRESRYRGICMFSVRFFFSFLFSFFLFFFFFFFFASFRKRGSFGVGS